MTDQTLADLMAAARRIDAEVEAATRQPAQPPANPGTDQGETLEALETRLRNTHETRQRAAGFEADLERNTELMHRALLSRGIRPPSKPDNTSNADQPQNLRLDGSAWTPADVRTARELEKYLPGIDLLGARTPPGFRR